MPLRHGTRKDPSPEAFFRSGAGRRVGDQSAAQLLEQLKLERARLKATRDALMDPHIMLEAVRDEGGAVVDFVFADANDSAIVYNHSTREALIGARLLSLLPGLVRSGVFKSYVRTVETGQPLMQDDSTYFNEIWGSERHCDVRAIKVGDGLSYTWRDVPNGPN